MATPSEKDMFQTTYTREHETTLKVLRAFPADKGTYTSHPKNNTAIQIGWTFAVENNVMIMALKGPLELKGFPPAPDKFADVVVAYEKSTKDFMAVLAKTPEKRMNETVKFFSGPKQMADYRVIDFLWFMLMDSIHHRGQLSTYIRPAGGKVPSIYGPSGDEPWM
jgi:hypothetical protein